MFGEVRNQGIDFGECVQCERPKAGRGRPRWTETFGSQQCVNSIYSQGASGAHGAARVVTEEKGPRTKLWASSVSVWERAEDTAKEPQRSH